MDPLLNQYQVIITLSDQISYLNTFKIIHYLSKVWNNMFLKISNWSKWNIITI